jgi:hypothetical protein
MSDTNTNQFNKKQWKSEIFGLPFAFKYLIAFVKSARLK